MPTETKNSTANASRIGSASDAARRLKSDRPTTMPARNAPSAIDTPKTAAEPTAMPERDDEHGQREQLARPRRGDPIEQPRDDARCRRRTVNATRPATLTSVERDGRAERRAPTRRRRTRPAAAPARAP